MGMATCFQNGGTSEAPPPMDSLVVYVDGLNSLILSRFPSPRLCFRVMCMFMLVSQLFNADVISNYPIYPQRARFFTLYGVHYFNIS